MHNDTSRHICKMIDADSSFNSCLPTPVYDGYLIRYLNDLGCLHLFVTLRAVAIGTTGRGQDARGDV